VGTSKREFFDISAGGGGEGGGKKNFVLAKGKRERGGIFRKKGGERRGGEICLWRSGKGTGKVARAKDAAASRTTKKRKGRKCPK